MTLQEGSFQKDEQLLPVDERSHKWFLSRFETGVKTLSPFPIEDKGWRSQQFDIDKVNLTADKLTAVVIKRFPDGRYELLLGDKRESGYSLGDHDKIIEFNTLKDSKSISLSWYFESQSKRYLIMPDLDNFTENTGYRLSELNDEKTTNFVKAMQEYHISTIFASSSNDPEEVVHLSSNISDMIVIGNFIKTYDNLVRDSYISGLAQQFGWTNNEMMRYRLSNELPEWKPPAYRQKSV